MMKPTTKINYNGKSVSYEELIELAEQTTSRKDAIYYIHEASKTYKAKDNS